MSDTVPVIDLAPVRAGADGAADSAARAIDDALCSMGFFVIRGHGLSSDYLASTAEMCRQFFDLPVAQKEAVLSTAQGSSRGYVRFGHSALSRTMGVPSPGDYKEMFLMGPAEIPMLGPEASAVASFYSPNVWPRTPADMRPVLEAYYHAMEQVGDLVLELMARALHINPGYFIPLFRGHNSTLTVINYPEQETPPLPGQLRAGAHTDYGAITILRGEDKPGGLQVRTRQGDWLDIHAPDDALVINVGDLLMRWTNDRWLSNIHRVANPPTAAVGESRRQSIAFFSNPREDVLIAALPTCVDAAHPQKHPPILAGQHRIEKIQAALRT